MELERNKPSKIKANTVSLLVCFFNDPVADDKTALVLMPGMAFTKDGKRMGYGGGFYDKFLAAEPDHPTVALCYDFQMVEDLPNEDYDIPVDCVLWA